MNNVRFAAIQMTSGVAVDRNLAVTAECIHIAAREGAQLVVLPENFSSMGLHEADRSGMAEAAGQGPVQDFLADQAVRNKIWIVGGTLPVKSDDALRPYAASLVFNPNGEQVARYDKMHLFDVGIPGQQEHYRESSHTYPGHQPVLVELPWGKLILSICYDLRFPELFRCFAAESPQFIVVPAAFTVATGKAHWQKLLQARAVENLCYVIAAAQVGTHENGRQTFGHSMIISPWGETLAEASGEVGVISAALDLEHQAQLRQRFPVLNHQRIQIKN